MLCISVAPVSRKLAKADLLNASRQCDLIELCIDHFAKEPDIGEILQGISKPIVVACRRPEAGGKFDGTEEERLTLLRQAIIAGPEYIELDLDAAARIPRFGKTKRLISITSLEGPPADVDAIYDKAANLKADVIKFAWPTSTFEAAWPMMKVIAQKRPIPAIGLGIGRAAVTLALVGKMLDVPWSYAALEKGLEAVPGQPTVAELKQVYCWDDVNPKTRFVGLLGSVDRQTSAIAATLNRAFRKIGDRSLCLPLPVQSFEHLFDRLERLKIAALLVAPDFAAQTAASVPKLEGSARASDYADLLLHQPEGWTGYNTIWRHALSATEARINKEGKEHPLERRNVLVIGSGGMARAFIHGVQQRKGIVSITGPDDKEAQQLAQKFSVRHVPFHNLYDTLAEVIVVADASIRMGPGKGELNPAYFRSLMTVIDLSAKPEETPILAEARGRGCRIVEPKEVFQTHLAAQFESLTGKTFPAEVSGDV